MAAFSSRTYVDDNAGAADIEWPEDGGHPQPLKECSDRAVSHERVLNHKQNQETSVEQYRVYSLVSHLSRGYTRNTIRAKIMLHYTLQ